jgi:DNA-binding IclR family transcriptional regulator
MQRNKYYSAPQHRLANFVMALVGHEATGLTCLEIAKKAKASSTQVTMTLNNLEAVGWVEKHPSNDKAYRLTAMFSQMANTIQIGLRAAVQQLDQDQQNYNKIY